MTKVALQDALPIVEKALADAEAEIGPAPGFADQAYFARRKAVMDRYATRLRKHLGASINDRWDGCRVRIAGVSSTCTAGMTGALQNWTAAARRKLQAAAC